MTQNKVDCRCGDEHEVYDGYRTCPFFHTKVNVLASKEDADPIHILSTGKWIRNVPDAELGLSPDYRDNQVIRSE